VSDKPQTTRTRVRGVLTRPGAQVVFVDTPGIHKPVSALGRRLNVTAGDTIADVDVVCLVVDATAPVGRGDQWVASRCPPGSVVVLNKVDRATPAVVMEQLRRAGELAVADGSAASASCELYPVSARTGRGVKALVEHLVARLPEGPAYYPAETVADVPEAVWVAELVREQLFRALAEELPYSVATRVTEWDDEGRRGPHVRCEVIVERDSQKGIVIGRGGEVLKRVGEAVRRQMPEGSYLELFVRVDRNWQHRPERVERLLADLDG